MPSLADRAAIVVFSRILTTAIDLVIMVAIVRLLSKSEFAVMSYLLMIYQSARYIAALGFPDSVFYFFERISGKTWRAFAFQTLGLMAIFGLAAGLILLLLPMFVTSILSSDWTQAQVDSVRRLMPYLAIVGVCEIPTWCVPNIMLSMDRQKSAAWYSLIMSLLTFLSLILPLTFGYPVETAFVLLAWYSVVRLGVSVWWIRHVIPPSTEPLPKSVRQDQIAFSIHVGLSSLAGRLNKYIDKFVVAALLPASALSDYSVGAQEIPLLAVVPFAVGSVLISRYVRFVLHEEREKLLRLWHDSVSKVTLLVVPVGVFFIFFAEDFIFTLFGSEYANAILPFRIFTMITLHRVTSYGSLLQSFGMTRAILYLSVGLVLANTLLSIMLTTWLGIPGTALAAFLANMGAWYAALRIIGRRMDIPFYKVLPFPFYGKTLAVSIVAGGLSLAIRTWPLPFEPGVGGLFAAAFVYLAAFITMAGVFGLLRPSDWRVLRRWLLLGMDKTKDTAS